MLKLFFLMWLAAVPTLALSSPLNEAERILRGARSTTYTHTPFVNEHLGIFEFDCSSFAAYVLERVRGAAYEELNAHSSGNRPLARDFVTITGLPHSGRHWSQVQQIKNLRPGDFIAWLIPAGSTSADTGHVMIVGAKPVANPALLQEWLVKVIDASSSGHGKADPRRRGGPNGVGSGVVGLIADNSDRPVAFRWSGGESKEVKVTTIRMARALPESAPAFMLLGGPGGGISCTVAPCPDCLPLTPFGK